MHADYAPGNYLKALNLKIVDNSKMRCVSWGTGIRRYAIKDASGHVLGDLYGLILKPRESKKVTISGDEIYLGASSPDFRLFENQLLDQMRGSFVTVTHTGLPPRLYPDCASTLPIVYCSRTKRAGTSAAVILDEVEYNERFLVDRYDRLVKRRGLETWIPGTLTAHAGVKRLLPNHYLDLANWKVTRFWPRQGEFTRETTADAAAPSVANELVDFIGAATKEHQVKMSLTAGFDSRLLLAAARKFTDRVDFFTFCGPRPGIDCIMAQKVAKSAGVVHQIYPFVEATEVEQRAWDFATGHTIRHPNRKLHSSVRQLDCRLILTGILGETGRARMYRNDAMTVDKLKPTPERILYRMNLPWHPDVAEDIQFWLDELNWLPFSAILDLAVLELFYMPLFRGAQFAQMPELMPYAERAVQNAFLSVPPEEKASERLFRKTISLLWPDGLAIPINRYGDYRDVLDKLTKLRQLDRVLPRIQRGLEHYLPGRVKSPSVRSKSEST